MTNLLDEWRKAIARAGYIDIADEIDPCSGGDEQLLEGDEIPMRDCVEVLHKIADKIEAIG